MSPLSPQPSKLRGQLQAPVYAVSPLSPLVPAQNNDSGSKTSKCPPKCAPSFTACPPFRLEQFVTVDRPLDRGGGVSQSFTDHGLNRTVIVVRNTAKWIGGRGVHPLLGAGLARVLVWCPPVRADLGTKGRGWVKCLTAHPGNRPVPHFFVRDSFRGGGISNPVRVCDG